MANPLTRSLAGIFRDRAELTSLKKLKKEGFRRVQVLDVSRLEDLVLHAVEKVLLAESSDPQEGRRLAKSAHVEFLRMLGEKDSLQRATDDLRKEQSSLQQNIHQMYRTLEATRQERDRNLQQQQKLTLQSLQSLLEERLDRALAQSLGDLEGRAEGAPVIAQVKGTLASVMMDLLSQAVQSGRPSESEEEDEGKVALLERRIRKLNASLTDAQEMMTRLRSRKSAEEEGVASVYKDVQGLSGDEQNVEQRRALLKEVFELNLQLKHDIDGPAAATSGQR